MATITEDDDDNVAAVQPGEGAEVDVENEPEARQEPEVEVVEDTGDERLSQSDESDDERPQRHRETAAERRARAKQAKDRDKRELEFQRKEIARMDALVSDLKKQQVVSSVTVLDSRIATAQAEADQFDRIFGAAITAQKGDDARRAAELRDAARNRAWDADQQKQQLIHNANQSVVKPVPYLDKAQAFMAANSWYNPNGNDEDSRLVTELDEAVSKEYIPTSDAYWNELQRRVKKNLPHKFGRAPRQEDDTQDDVQDTRQRKGPPTGGSSRSNSSTATQIKLSPERIAAMKEAGYWDDPKLHAKMVKKYSEYDRNSRG
jgi:hypothetical protein